MSTGIPTETKRRTTPRYLPTSGITYRPDIDGLRAIAVLAVIGFHAAPRFVPGGFVGVDVFFVISGFLISGILFEQLEQGTFSFAEFYARRIRRIFPALIVVLLGCGVVGWFALTGAEYRQMQKHAAGGSFFVSNILLWVEAGYFDAPSALKPLLHLWSLAIEEQFYLFWPPLLYFCWTRRANVLSVIILIVAGSFAFNVAVAGGSAVAAFYSPATRMWELLVGGLLAYVERFRKDRVETALKRVLFTTPGPHDDRLVANIKAWGGFGLIVFAIAVLSNNATFPAWWIRYRTLRDVAGVFGLDRGIPYPGWWAGVPTLGAACLLWAGSDAWINRMILRRPTLVAVGLMSYPLYLWHWPLLAFLQITESGRPSLRLEAAAVAMAFVLAWLTYRLVERPVRRTMSGRTPFRIAAVALVLLLVGALSLVSYETGAITSRHPYFVTQLAAALPLARTSQTCKERFPNAGEYCQEYVDGVKVTTALLGDSHAEHFLPGVGSYLLKKGENVVHLGESGCPPLWDVERLSAGQADSCHSANPSVLAYVEKNDDITRVILSFRGALDVDGSGYGGTENFGMRYGIPGTALSAGAAIKQALEHTVDRLLKRGKKVSLILQVPELSFDITECVGRPFSFENRIRTPCAEPRAAVLERQASYRRIVDEVRQTMPSLTVFDPMPFLCDDRWCDAIRSNVLLYQDNNHLSAAGSLFFADKFTFD